MLPRATSRARSGVATIAWKILFHCSPPRIGKLASNEPVCISDDASRPGREELQVADATEDGVRRAIDVAAEPEAHRRQEQDGNAERAEERRPERPPVLVALDARSTRRDRRPRRRVRPRRPAPPPAPPEPRAPEPPRERDRRLPPSIARHYSISDRPVSRRNTSSSVDRRTRTVSGWSPRSRAAMATPSPSSA